MANKILLNGVDQETPEIDENFRVDVLLHRPMRIREAKIVCLLAKKSGKYVISPALHNARGLAGALGVAQHEMYSVLAGMEAQRWIQKTPVPGRTNKNMYRVVSCEVLEDAMKLLNLRPSPNMIDCSKCGSSYSSTLKSCPGCADIEAKTLIDADVKEETALAVIKEINLPACPGADLTGVKVVKTKGQCADVEWHRTHAVSGDMNAMSKANKEKVQKEHKKFAEWCDKQGLSDLERFSLHILINQDGSFVDSIYWKVRACCLVDNNLSETEKVFKTHVGKKHMIAQVLDCVKRIDREYSESKIIKR